MKQVKSTVKMWVGIGAVAALGASAALSAREGATPADHPGQFHGDFNSALNLILMGEGGEAGIGLSKMWPTVSAPALTAQQIKKLVAGNTLSVPQHYSMQFNADGSLGGYMIELAKASDPKACPKQEVIGDQYLMHDGACHTRVSKAWKGSWRIEEHQLCVDLRWSSDARKDCWHVAILLDRIALFDTNGAMFGKGNILKKGRAGDE